MSAIDNYSLEPNYSTGVSGWANSSTNDQWLIKNRGNSVTINGTTMYTSSLHTNRDEPHSAYAPFIPVNISASVDNGRGSSVYFQCVSI